MGAHSSWLTESAREIARGLVYALTHGAFALRSGTTCAAIPSCPSCPTCPSSIQAGDLSWLILAAFALGLLIGVGLTLGAVVIAHFSPSSTKRRPLTGGPTNWLSAGPRAFAPPYACRSARMEPGSRVFVHYDIPGDPT